MTFHLISRLARNRLKFGALPFGPKVAAVAGLAWDDYSLTIVS